MSWFARSALFAACFVVLALGIPQPALANFAFSVSPPRFELKAVPGQRLRQVIELTNVANQPTALLIKTADWAYQTDGGVAFVDELAADSCRPWIALERRELLVAASQPYRFRFEVTVPAGQTTTECRFAILLEGKEPSLAGASQSIPIGARVAVIVYVAVGDAAPNLSLVSSAVELRDGKRVPVILIRNSGTAHGRLEGFLAGTDANGKRLEASPVNSPILPGETRKIVLTVSERTGTDASIEPVFPVTFKGVLEWGKNQTLDIDQRFGP